MILKKYLPNILLIALVIIVYWPSFSGDFIFDDNNLVKNNPYVKSLHSISSYLAQEDGIVDKTVNTHLHTGFYRPLLNFSYYIDYKVWGMKAFGFRLTNIVLHGLCCLLIFQLLLRLNTNRTAALAGSIFFALHPLNTESVSMIVCRNNLLVTIFCILALICYLECRRGRWIYVFASSLFFGLALLSKEVSVMLIFVFFLYNRLLFRDNRDLTGEFMSYLPFLFLLTAYLILRAHVIGAFASPMTSEDFPTRLYFIPYIIGLNFLLAFFPSGLHSFYLKYPEHYLGYEGILSYIIFLLLAVALWRLRHKTLLIFSVACFVVSMFPVLGLIPIASPSIITMRWLYFPLAFLSIGVAYLIQTVWTSPKTKTLGTALMVIIFAYFGAYTYVLADTLWKNQRSFLNIEVLHFKNVLFADALAGFLHDEKKYAEAEALYITSLNAFPKKVDTYINYSALLIDTGRPESAKVYLMRSKSLIMTTEKRCEWFNNMGIACAHMNQKQCALDNLSRAVRSCPDHPVFKNNLDTVKSTAP